MRTLPTTLPQRFSEIVLKIYCVVKGIIDPDDNFAITLKLERVKYLHNHWVEFVTGENDKQFIV